MCFHSPVCCRVTVSHVTDAVFKLGARFLNTFEVTDENHGVDLLCCSPHCEIAESCLTNDTRTHSVRVLTATTTDTDRLLPVIRRKQSVPSVSSTMQLFKLVCCSALAASYIFFGDILCFILCYRLLFPYCTS